ncbi:MAG: hypothetical protein AAF196_20720, partial [Planctomycetota bacterium]
MTEHLLLDRMRFSLCGLAVAALLGLAGCSATYAEANGEVDSILGFDADGAEPSEYRVRTPRPPPT